jgi:hypothetical protein
MKWNLKFIYNLLIVVILLLSGCKGSSGSKYSFLDTTNNTTTTTPITVSINTFSPATDPVIMASTAQTTFAVSLAQTDSTVKYIFTLDNTTSLQDGPDPFYVINAASLTAGNHTLKVRAYNATSEDSHTFNFIVNTPPSITSFTPTLTSSTTLSCGIDSINLSALYSEIDAGDSVTVRWYLNENQVNFGNATSTVSNDTANKIAAINFHPDCTQTGINFLRMSLNDGHETTTLTWTVYVSSPVTIHIADSTPTTDPVILTNASNTTFGVTLAVPDNSANYQFILDNVTTVQNDHHTYYSILGSSLAAGAHTLKVIASNTTTSDFKIFHIRKNTPAATTAYSPALTGGSISCGVNPVVFYADMLDVDSDSLSYAWTLDGAVSSYITPTGSPTRASMNFVPNCALNGSHTVELKVNDGYEVTTVTWSISITSPITVHIASYSPTTAPLILNSTGTTTFTVALTTSDSSVTYDYLIDGTNDVYNGSNPYYNLNSTLLTPGSHSLKITASNSSSSDNHTYNFTINSPAVFATTTPALTGSTLACGVDTLNISSHYTDADLGDTHLVKWYLNGTLVTGANSLVTLNNDSANKIAAINYHPDCSHNGINLLKLEIDDGHEVVTQTWTTTVAAPITISISSVTPTPDPYLIVSGTTTTFGVSLATPDPTANYQFILDNTTTVQNTHSSYYNLSSGSLTTGVHTLKVIVSNSTSTDFHTFNINVNSPPSTISFIPNLTGTNLNCGLDSVNISALYTDADSSDTVSATWYLNQTQINFGNATATVANDTANKIASVNFHPNCTQTGINFIQLSLNDGHETTNITWTIYVIAPVTILISDATPATNPTILTAASSTTFAVSLSTPDSNAKYDFYLDNTTPLQINDRKSYYTLAGSSLSVGTHTLKVHAFNSTSSDDKIFNLRKNSLPVQTAFSPAFSGTTVNCGTAPITLYADMFDANGDSLSYTWTLDDAPSSYLTASNSGNRAQVSFNPSCAIAGTRVVKVLVSDGYESTTLTWSITVATPIAVSITSFLPATNPTVMTNSQTTTFAIALSNSDPNVTYTFTLKNLSTLATTTLQSGSIPFYNLVGSSVSAGLYELKAMATNGTSSDSHTFTVRKNSQPSVPPIGFTFSPTLTGTVLSCGSSTQIFQSDISDLDGDIMAITWSLDGNSSASNLLSTSTQSLAKATYTPSCSEVGVKTIKVDVFDGFETTSKTWTVQIINPTVVAINVYSPSTDPVNVLSSGAQTFTVSATGKAPLAYEWKLDGAVISAATDTYYTLSASSLTTGVHTLIVKVSDSDSNQSHTFNIVKNAPPSLSNKNPTAASAKININTVMNFSANYSDANSDTMTVTWKLNNVTVGGSHPNASVSTSSNLTTLTLSPSSNILGDNTIDLIISDGKESTTWTWTANVNYFSDICNNMGAGRACTILGQPGMGSNINPTTTPQKVRIQPDYIEPYGDASGSYFFTDAVSHSVWLYNKSAIAINILGQSISAYTLKVVVGTGMNGTGTTGTMYNDFPFTNPKGVAWDSANGRLFVADDSNSRVVLVDNTGLVTVVFGGGANNTAGNQAAQLATASYCNNPYGLTYSATQNRLYVACYSSHTIKYVDTSNPTISAWTATVLVGALTGGASGSGSVNGTNGSAGTAKINAPSHLKYDATNNVLYTYTAGDCRVRATETNGTAHPSYYFGAVTLSANSTTTYVGSSCGTFAAGGYASTVFNGGYRSGLELDMTGATLNGIYVSDYNTHRIVFINNTLSSRTIGNAAVASYSSAAIWGNGTAGYYMPCSFATASTCYANNPSSLTKFGNYLYLTDYSNYRIRYLDVSVNSGSVTDEIGYDSKAGFGGNGGTSSENVQFNTPLNLYFDNNSNRLLISDFYNYRVRALNLTNGRIDSYISNGNGNANTSQADPSTLGMRGPRAVTNYNNFILFNDTTNSNCLTRALNSTTSTQTILGISTNANAVQTVIGNYANGCGLWNTAAATGTSASIKLNNPNGITTDGTYTYIANTSDHCILKIDQNGNLMGTNGTFAGLCGTMGTANAAGIAYSNSSVRFTYPSTVMVDPRTPYNTSGNLFVLDQTNNNFSTVKIRYINQYSSAVTIYGVTVNPGEIKTIYTATDNYGGDLAVFDNQVCFSTGGGMINGTTAIGNSNNSNNTVICFNRDDSTGTTFTRFGRNPSVYIGHGASQHDQEDEGAPATGISLVSPAGITFDSNGNLYIAERNAHTIRKITRWW